MTNLYTSGTGGVVGVEGRPRAEGDRLWTLTDAEVKLHIAHKTRVAVRERQVTNVGALPFTQLSVCWVDQLRKK